MEESRRDTAAVIKTFDPIDGPPPRPPDPEIKRALEEPSKAAQEIKEITKQYVEQSLHASETAKRSLAARLTPYFILVALVFGSLGVLVGRCSTT